MTGVAAIAGWMLGLGLVLLAREFWCHHYYPVRGQLYQSHRNPQLAAAAWEGYLATRTLWGRRRKLAARVSLSHCYYRLGRLAEAAEQCEHLERQSGDTTVVTLAERMRRDCLARLGQVEPAEQPRAPAAGARNEASLHAEALEVERLLADGIWFGAMRQLEQLVEDAIRAGIGDRHLPYRLQLGELRLRLGFYEEAASLAETLLGRAGLPSELQHDSRQLAARAALALARHDQALLDAQAAFRIANLAHDRERLIHDCLLLGAVAEHRLDYVDAMRHFQRVRECGGRGRWLAYLGEAELLALWGREREAERAFQKAAEGTTDPAGSDAVGMAVAVAHAAMILRDSPQRACELVEPYLESPAPQPRLSFRRDAVAAVVLTAVGRADEAAVCLERLRGARGSFAHDRHLMVEFDHAEAELARLAGRWSEAAGWLKQALERGPHAVQVPRLQVFLGDMLEAAGDLAAARQAFQAAAEFSQPLGAVREARARLELLPATSPSTDPPSHTSPE
ncbi:MAG: hypothetical protein HYU66_17730 [Armatimonadetes bacterium]|nr:hypothetical protein [Armatimonadota bacterium]